MNGIINQIKSLFYLSLFPKCIQLIPKVGPISEQQEIVTISKGKSLSLFFSERRFLVSVLITDSQNVVLSVSVVSKKGNPVTIPSGSIAWTVDNGSVLTITPAADALSTQASAVGPVGKANVTATLGNLSGTFEVDVQAGPAASLVISAGTPTDQ